ncbi:MAG: hypothetical protein SH847_11190 [Roseiflexaceae bacterium]|nr:hypothetical protein [Roseiflexaceae bacterium]
MWNIIDAARIAPRNQNGMIACWQWCANLGNPSRQIAGCITNRVIDRIVAGAADRPTNLRYRALGTYVRQRGIEPRHARHARHSAETMSQFVPSRNEIHT